MTRGSCMPMASPPAWSSVHRFRAATRDRSQAMSTSIKAEQKQKSHDAILASAAALLLERGIRASSVMDVMKGAGLTVGGFYGHFESKEQLFTETIRRTARAMWSGLLQRSMSDPSRSAAQSVLDRYL